jgi:hypothetical protein
MRLAFASARITSLGRSAELSAPKLADGRRLLFAIKAHRLASRHRLKGKLRSHRRAVVC